MTTSLDLTKLSLMDALDLAILIEEEARLAKEQRRLAIWEEVLDTIDLSFIHSRKRATEPLVKAIAEGIRQVWNVTDPIPGS